MDNPPGHTEGGRFPRAWPGAGPPAFALGRARYDGAMRTHLILTLALFLAACQKADTEPGPGGVTADEARALDEAAQMIEDRRPSTASPTLPSPAPTGTPLPAASAR